MTTLNDEIMRVTGGPTLNDGENAYFFLTVDRETLNGRTLQWLRARPGISFASISNLNDAWTDYLVTALGYSGTLNDMQLRYWNSQ